MELASVSSPYLTKAIKLRQKFISYKGIIVLILKSLINYYITRSTDA